MYVKLQRQNSLKKGNSTFCETSPHVPEIIHLLPQIEKRIALRQLFRPQQMVLQKSLMRLRGRLKRLMPAGCHDPFYFLYDGLGSLVDIMAGKMLQHEL